MSSRIILAMDNLNIDAKHYRLLQRLDDRLYAVKIHHSFDTQGRRAVIDIQNACSQKVWVDLKLHDIPDAVTWRATAISDCGADILTVHASGGIKMMRAAVAAFAGDVLAVTTLTSLDEGEIQLLYGQSSTEVAIRLARFANTAGVPGIVCSSKDVGTLSRLEDLQQMNFVVPGVRSFGKELNDQSRVGTPFNAIKAGATYIVVGRQITEAADPLAAFDALEEEVHAAENYLAAAALPE